jgi:transposase InsO family protein
MPLRENNHMGRNCDTPLRQSFQKIWTTGRNHSDRDPRFAAHAFQELLKLLNIKSNLTTAYHPQSDGATKRVNQEIKAFIARHTQKTGYTLSALWNSHTTIEDTLNEFIPHLN